MEAIVKVGKMPGGISEYAVAPGTKVAEVLNMAGLDSTGFDVKVDGTKVDPAVEEVNEDTNLILLVQQVKGNR